MKVVQRAFVLSGLALLLFAGMALAGPDDYIGDTAIYGGETAAVKPNVLLILDTSGSMDQEVPGAPYDSSNTYPSTSNCWKWEESCFFGLCTSFRVSTTCQSSTVYRKNGLFTTYWEELTSLSSVTTSCGGNNPREILSETGQWHSTTEGLHADGSCNASGRGSYKMGNYINWESSEDTALVTKIDIARNILQSLIASTSGVNFGLMVFDQERHWALFGGWFTRAEGGEFCVGATGEGQGYRTTIKDMDAEFTPGVTNRQALLSVLGEFDESKTEGGTPLGETLYEASRYFQGEESAFGHGSYVSPIEARCQANYVILISDGMSSGDLGETGILHSRPIFDGLCTTAAGASTSDCDGDSHEAQEDERKDYGAADPKLFGFIELPPTGSDYLDDVAWFLYNNDMAPDEDLPGEQNVITYTVGFGVDAVAEAAGANLLLEETAENGGGEFFSADNGPALAGAFSSILGSITDINTSFVAPVVPVSPENRTFSASRVYLGFFKPVPGADWKGNLKKFGLLNGALVDKNGLSATLDDGSFRSTATSYWSSTVDGGEVDQGGAGGLLLARDFTSDPRRIYTHLGETARLSDDRNHLTPANPDLTAAHLGVANDIEKNKLINYIHGIDAYDGNLNGSTAEKRGWILGDILHSKPAIVHYSTFTPAQESDPGMNRTMIYFGSNDGMLHAVRDADGKEMWAFIPDNLLPDLKYLNDSIHSYYVDSSPVPYIFDANGNGEIEPGSGDKVILLFGQRRGGGEDTLQAARSRGAYYALDVTNPDDPQFLWKIDNTVSGFEELGETWSEPTLARVRVDGAIKIAAFVGAGYDNNEDRRFGNTQAFPEADATTDTTFPTADGGNSTSEGTSAAFHPKGRGIYAIEVATLDSYGVPTVAASPTKLWGYTDATFSFASELAVLDSDYNGLIDRVYGGDTGGNLWRCFVGSTDATQWDCSKIFASNPSDASVSNESPVTQGRKIFYRPSITIEPDHIGIYFGTGDRAHPTNTAVVDRLYSIKDRGQRSTKTEADLVNLTENYLQAESLTGADLERVNANAGLSASDLTGAISGTLQQLKQAYGWFVKLDQNHGEKVLAPPLVFNKTASFTTFTPDNSSTADPCLTGNLGQARYYALDYLTAEAVLNFDPWNDTESTENNERAFGGEEMVLRRSDRVKDLGSGIPSGPVLIMPPQGDPSVLVGSGDGLTQLETVKGSTTIPIYWIQE